jgi:hypothetical protein
MKFLQKKSIKAKITIGFSVVTLVLAATVLITLIKLGDTTNRMNLLMTCERQQLSRA